MRSVFSPEHLILLRQCQIARNFIQTRKNRYLKKKNNLLLTIVMPFLSMETFKIKLFIYLFRTKILFFFSMYVLL